MYPLTTEKTTRLSGGRTYVFRVDPRENKIEVWKEIERLYKVKVAKISMSWARAKKRRLGRIEGIKPGFKKAMVTLKEGHTIEV
ncbi:MAG: 50S ribosomal protein L23 [Candidatus Portnoybacteria bacterium]|nr:50S ribosomal protein L23 [Candidatus Portnoybacteria bacterium]